MKTKIIFERTVRAVLIAALACNLLGIPTQPVSAKLLAALYDCTSQTQIPLEECEALVILYNSTNGDSWFDNTGWLQTATPCSWVGITCYDGNVDQLYLWENNLSGFIPSALANLTELGYLSLTGNTLSGPIPPELGNLTELTRLLINENTLSGSIPPELGNLTELTTLLISDNTLSGPIPPELGNLTKLDYLNLGNSGLSGVVPGELGNLNNLSLLMLDHNDLSGSIPLELGNLINLSVLMLGHNDLSGPIPPELGNLTNLTQMVLRSNVLSGPIPTELGNLTNLYNLNLADNDLSGSIPPELGNLTNLWFMELNNNAFSGSIPSELGNLTGLGYMYLNGNELSGAIPPELGNLVSLRGLILSGNGLKDLIPPELGNLTNLTFLFLNQNQLNGEFPISITNLDNLTGLTFDCELTSSDPDVVAFIDGVTPGWQNATCPVLTSPSEGATLDNGRLDELDDVIWDFDWSDVPGAASYQLLISRSGEPIIDEIITDSSYQYIALNSHIDGTNLADWAWQVRAFINDQWGEWSEIRPFSVEPPDADAAQSLAKNGGLNAYVGKSRIPRFWKAVNFSALDGKSTSVKQEGKASVKITGAAGLTKTLSQTLMVSGPAGDRFIFSYRVKGTALPASGVCRGQVLFYSGSQLKGAKTLKCPTGTTYNWKQAKLNISAPAAYTKVVIKFTYSKPGGVLWLDAVSLVR